MTSQQLEEMQVLAEFLMNLESSWNKGIDTIAKSFLFTLSLSLRKESIVHISELALVALGLYNIS